MTLHKGTVETTRFAGIQFLFWASIVCFEAFMVPFLTDNGYSPSQAGFVMSAVFGFAILGQPIVGSLSDRMNSPRWIITVAMAAAAAGAVILPQAVGVYGIVVAIALLYSLTANSLPAVLDAWIMARRRHNPGVSYGIARGFGSLGFALAALVFGAIANRFGIPIVFLFYAGLAVGVAILALLMPRPVASESLPVPQPGRSSSKRHLLEGLQAAATNGPYIALLVATFVAFLGFRAAMTFLPLLLSSVGGTVADVGVAHSIAAVSEAPLLFLSGALIRRVRGPKLIAGVLLLMAVRLFVYSLLGSPGAILILQVSHGITFGIFLAAVVDYIDVIAPEDHRSLFQAIAPSVFFGLGSVAGSWLGGVGIEAFSLQWVYRTAGLLALVGALIVIVFNGRRRTTRGAVVPERS
ncbi:MAG TPA: MFS transporter [Spirochaetia bacterium]|nr:MFS transporter [Spirochaetia bacterium]